ncbi:MAG: hypothetical protein CVT84_12845 [Alphaproteobacteria bacterium HGW-Alphaproteobacteria-6]|nr:MAG: hypothetical protein CVT84_12845 [Alphaproteobacteria bacterium HGW-Alphaproteobacteria-6]
MAVSSTVRGARPLADRVDSFFAGLGQGFNAYLERRSRSEEIRRLDAMSDAELAAMGISRDRIAHHVFRDLFYL